MRLTPKEMDRLTIFSAAELARRRRAKGLKLNHPEAVALICDELLEDGREGKSYEEISEITGVNLGTVKSRLHRARNSFAQRIEPFLN